MSDRQRPRAAGTSLRQQLRAPRQLGTNKRAGDNGPAIAAERLYRQAFARWKVRHGYAALCTTCDDTGFVESAGGMMRCHDHRRLTPEQVRTLLVPRM
jgi:hypothetical protein